MQPSLCGRRPGEVNQVARRGHLFAAGAPQEERSGLPLKWTVAGAEMLGMEASLGQIPWPGWDPGGAQASSREAVSTGGRTGGVSTAAGS
jgi:hypothetical protein